MKFVSSILLFTFWSGLWGQYANVVNITDHRFENTYNWLNDNDTLKSVGFYNDSNTQNFGWNTLRFATYNSNYSLLSESTFQDSMNRYSCFYGFEKIYDSYYNCGVRYDINNTDSLRGFIVKYNDEGNLVWIKDFYDSIQDVRINYFAQSNDKLYALMNLFDASTSTQLGTMLTKLDTSGNILQEKFFSGYSQQPLSLRKTLDNGFIISTRANYHFGALNPLVYKLDSNLNIKWQKVLGPPDRNHALQFFELPNGNYLGVGSSEEPATGYSRAWLVELDSANGQVLKDTVYWFADRYSLFNVYSNIIYEEDGLILIASRSANPIGSNPPYHSLIIKMDYNYSIMWSREYYHSEYANPLYNMYEKDNFYHFQGLVFHDSPTNTNDEWFLVVDSMGCDDAVCTVGIDDAMYQYYNEANLTIFPNPVASDLYIKLEDTKDIITQVTILDALGNVVQRSNLSQNIDVSMLSNGIYLLQITTKEKKYAKKFIIQR